MTASSDSLSKVGATFLQLKLVLADEHNHRQNVLMELSLPQFYHFLGEMERAQAQCKQAM